LVVKDIKGGGEQRFLQGTGAVFTADNKNIIFLSKDSLYIVQLSRLKVIYRCKAERFSLFYKRSRPFLIWQDNRKTSVVTLKDLSTWHEMSFKDAYSYNVSENGETIVLGRQLDAAGKQLLWYDVSKQILSSIWTGNGLVSSCTLSKNGQLFAFVETGSANEDPIIALYNRESGAVDTVLRSANLSLPNGYKIAANTALIFDKTQTKISFAIVNSGPKTQFTSGLTLWNYHDAYLPNDERTREKRRFVVYHVKEKKLDFADDSIFFCDFSRAEKYILVARTPDSPWFFYDSESTPLQFTSALPGQLGRIIERFNVNTSFSESFTLSPDSKYFVWYDFERGAWFSYSVEKKIKVDISSFFRVDFVDRKALQINRPGVWGIAGWLPSKKAVLVYDEFDIWELPVDGSTSGRCLTLGYGRRNKLTISIVDGGADKAYSYSEPIVVSGYDRQSKAGGYWKINLDHPSFETGHLSNNSIDCRMPVGIFFSAKDAASKIKAVKAKDADTYLVVRGNAQSSENAYYTSDLIHYKEVSEIHPERNYNWLTAELITYKGLDGRAIQGILYKPGSFDASKKYPLILNYYEKRSDELHKFLLPGFSSHNINIPVFVDHGYLVFVPDIYSSPGHNGDGTFNCIEAAAKYLSKLPFVDSSRLGLQGHSYGGWQTNYMVTHSSRFAAACEAAGVSDQVSAYGQLRPNDDADRQRAYELMSQGSPYGFGVTPWTHPDLYIKNSPIFNVDKINCPLLIMHNKPDVQVPFAQGIEMFINAKRAGKKVWLLQYDGQNHQVWGDSAEDYHIRMLQFFDHYLKGSLMPEWMDKTPTDPHLLTEGTSSN
jgi:dienelactone hydrolase